MIVTCPRCLLEIEVSNAHREPRQRYTTPVGRSYAEHEVSFWTMSAGQNLSFYVSSCDGQRLMPDGTPRRILGLPHGR